MKGSLAATFASRVYMALLALLMLPIYITHMGIEAYGLVALFLVLQIWFQLLDLGLSPTMARETARYRAGSLLASDFRKLMRALEGLFLALSVTAGLVLYLCADLLAGAWLKVEHLPVQEVADSLRIMAVCISMRLLSEMYRGVISGYERFAWLAASNAAFGTLRLVLVVPFFVWAGSTPSHFFGFQAAALAAETLTLIVVTYRMVPQGGGRGVPWRLGPMREVLPFSLVMSLASIVWVTLSQLDKLLLSGLLSLSEYGAFSLAVAAATSVLLVSGSLADVMMPRLTQLHAQGSHLTLTALYRNATQWAGIGAWSIAGVLAFHAEMVIWSWTGDPVLAKTTAPILSLYALGNAALAIGAFPYYLQFAEGKLRMHLLGTALLLVALVPSVVWASARFGGLGAAAVWFGVNALYLMLWTPVAHARVLPHLHRRWMAEDVLPIAVLAQAAAVGCQWLPWPPDRLGTGLMLLGVSFAVVATSAMGSSWVRLALFRSSRALV